MSRSTVVWPLAGWLLLATSLVAMTVGFARNHSAGPLAAMALLAATVMLVMHYATPRGLFRAGARPMRRRTCARCGYDISGLGPDLVCPECGAPRDDGIK